MIIRSVKDLGALVRDRRSKLKWSQDELASRVGVGRLWITQFEGGKTSAHIGLVIRTLKALDLTLSVDDGETKSSGMKGTIVDIDEIVAQEQQWRDAHFSDEIREESEKGEE